MRTIAWGLKGLLRYCLRPTFALERLREIDAERLVYEIVKPGAGGNVTLILSLYCLANGEAAIVGRRQFITKPSLRLRNGERQVRVGLSRSSVNGADRVGHRPR